MTLYLIAAAVFGVAAFAQAVTGFGFSLVSVPLLAMADQPQPAVVSATIISLLLNAVTAWRERAHAERPVARRLLLAVAVGMPLGLLLLISLPDLALLALIAVVNLASTVVVWRGWQLSPGAGTAAAAGILAGVLTTTTGTNGPPLVATLRAMKLEPRVFRATVALIFGVVGPVAVVGFGIAGTLTWHAVLLATAGLPATALGAWLGNILFHRLNPAAFRRLVLSCLAASALAALANATTRAI
ncbi:sulfite exporter TauE/SafE family protein [Catellatospora sp. KI3]|uniref:TSUP family transporter n=1 Tax=Catellatospora sp. KI3 TaxID=3041620 RepID=UPI0024827ABD|nr:sulfite exporter TauE/SafE family protein [Catellatospora sp. KI3]MDI1464665.1 sulfite exporter TauE/SafE family protein [Catellatospora sp. KI3]